MISLKVKKTNQIEKVVGLIGKAKAKPILIKTRFGIHTFLVKFPIDVLILDKNYLVKKSVENLKPNRIIFWNPLFNNVIELERGTIQKNKIKVGDGIKLIIES